MSDGLNKKISDILGKMDNKVLQTKLNAALDMLKKGKTEDLARRIKRIDKNELIEKANEFDQSKLKELNINVEDIKNRVTNEDLEKLKGLIGEHGDEIIKKNQDIIRRCMNIFYTMTYPLGGEICE